MKSILALVLVLFSLPILAEPLSIKNIDPQVKHSISRQEVYWMYTMRTRFWENGQKVTVYYQDFDSAAHKDFVINVLNAKPSSFAKSVEIYVNTGNAGYFRKSSNEAELKKEIAKVPGAIGYLDSKYMITNRDDNVEKLLISN